MIKRGMPYRFLLTILLCFACSKSEAPPPAATEAEQEPAVLPKVAADPSPVFPSVELVTAGERPRRVLRRDFAQGSKETLEVRTERKSTKGEVDSAAPQMGFNLPPVTFELAIETKEVSSDGTAQVGFEVVSLEVLGACCGYPREVRKVLEESGFEGTTGKYAIDSQGFVTDVELAAKSAGDEGAWQLLRAVFSQMSVPLPKEEVGEGGKWIVRREIEEGGIRIPEVLTVELAKIEGSRIALEVKIDRRASGRAPGVPVAGSKTVLELVFEGSQRFQGDLTNLVPESSRTRSTKKTTSITRGSDGTAKPTVTGLHSVDILSAKRK